MDRKIKVLVVDDSLIFRRFVEEALRGESDIEIVGSVMNGAKALEFIKSAAVPPDVVTMDVEMPVMNGLDALKAIQEFNAASGHQYGIGVIMVSSHTKYGVDTTIQALEAGAFDFIEKPNEGGQAANTERLKKSLTAKIRQYTLKRKVLTRRFGVESPAAETRPAPPPMAPKAVVLPAAGAKSAPAGAARAVLIGVSTGGPKALATMLPELSAAVDLPMFIVQHMPPLFTASLAASLNAKCRHTVVEAADGLEISGDHIYIAPGGMHMVLRKNDTGCINIGLNGQPPENGCRPSVDVLFRSAASVYSGDVITLILTGMGSDGAKGAAPLKRAGSHLIVQDEASSVVWGMPGSAVAAGIVDEVLPLADIPQAVKREIDRRREARKDISIRAGYSL
ncbi:MAG: chemotaxis response regulator protein-glutamate methylesterase [Nitrospinae bacterium]|nr:chemotaxis response regulator protein-glutamate methylesterase [Nitrospinota bacterium]